MSTGHGSEPIKTVLVTGTSRGIGLRLAGLMLRLGYCVIGLSRSDTPISDARFRHVRVDLRDVHAVEAVGRCIDASLFGVINNAGIHGPIGPFAEDDIDAWIETFYVNLLSPARLTQLCIPTLTKNKGFIMFLSGGGSADPRPNFSAYGVSKTAVVRLAEVLARELHPDVRVFCVAPGCVRTGLLEEAIRGGQRVTEEMIVDCSYVERLCTFLINTRDLRYSGKFIHVKDDYAAWGDGQLAPDAHALRRVRG